MKVLAWMAERKVIRLQARKDKAAAAALKVSVPP